MCRDPFHRRGYHFRFGDTPRVICLINAWVQLTTVLNELARSMGQHDLYPFVMWRPVLRKMQFIQMVVKEAREGQKVVG